LEYPRNDVVFEFERSKVKIRNRVRDYNAYVNAHLTDNSNTNIAFKLLFQVLLSKYFKEDFFSFSITEKVKQT